MKTLNKVKGFTLLEIFVALSIGLFLFAGVLSVFVGLRTTTQETSSYGELQENGRLAVSLITEDLMRAGFWGDLSGDLNRSILLNPPTAVGMTDDCVGQGINNGTFPAVNGHFRAIWGMQAVSSNPFGCASVSNVKVGTDILQIKRVLAQPEAGALNSSRFYLIANGNFGTIIHGGSTAANIPEVQGGQTWEYQHHIYNIEEENRNGVLVPELRRGSLYIVNGSGANGTIENKQVVEGIEDMRFLYGVDDDDDGVVDVYLPPSAMTNVQWDQNAPNKIIAVQMFILVREILPDLKYTNTNTYVLGDKQVVVNDNFRRLLFSSTAVLHNTRTEVWE